jgi:hypothetical protein
MIRPTLLLLVSTLTLSCGGSPSAPNKPDPHPQPDPHVTAGPVDLSIASVTLADDCGTGPTASPLSAAPAGAVPMGDSSLFAGAASRAARACEQSSVQLRVANKTEVPSKITIKKIELLDESGAVIGELTPRDASQWSGDTYQPWDEQVAANQVLQVSYALSRPAVSPGGTYIVRLVVVAGDGGEATIEQRKTIQAEASLPPGAVT